MSQNKNIIIGTAGHVDHGKTLLIKALTGIDTDRLKEEKKRGITIELGFAWLERSDGQRAGIVDVPGHEKFIKNMLAGAGGIDLALLVVAADDGVMPQTREHLGILRLLGIREGIVVITKTDLADPDWLELVKEDIREMVKDTFLEEAPIFPVSAYTGDGMDTLKEAIWDMVDRAGAKSDSGAFRIPVDRVFSVDGFGTVITGTMIEGSLSQGDEVEVYPTGTRTRVRNLQVHSRDVETAYAGQRVAVNLAGLSKDQVQRGDTLAVPDSMQNTMMVDVKLTILPDGGRVIENGTRLHFYHGARDPLCKAVLLDADALAPGQEGYAQLRFTEDIAVKKGDRFVVRFYSPVETVGGGVVLDPAPPKRRRHHEKTIELLRVREHGSATDNLAQAIDDASPRFTPLADIQKHLQLDDGAFRDELDGLVRAGRVVVVTDRVAVSASYRDVLAAKVKAVLGEYHEANPLQAGMRRDELRSRLLPGRDAAIADGVLTVLGEAGVLRFQGQVAALADFEIRYSNRDQQLADKVEALFRERRYTPPSPDELAEAFPKENASLKKLLEAMLAGGTLTTVAPGMPFHTAVVEEAKEKITAFITEHGEISLAQFRDLSGTSRKFALALLEYFDRHGVTKKVGDIRVLAKKR